MELSSKCLFQRALKNGDDTCPGLLLHWQPQAQLSSDTGDAHARVILPHENFVFFTRQLSWSFFPVWNCDSECVFHIWRLPLELAVSAEQSIILLLLLQASQHRSDRRSSVVACAAFTPSCSARIRAPTHTSS